MSWQFPLYDGEWKAFVEGRINFFKGECERIWKRMPEVSQQYPGIGANLGGVGIPGGNDEGGNQTRFWRIGVASQDISPGSSGNWQYGIGTQGSETGDGTDRVGYFYSLNQRGLIKSGDRIQAFWNGTAWELEQFQACLFFIGKTVESIPKGGSGKVQPWIFNGTSFAAQSGNPIDDVNCMPAAVAADRWVHVNFDVVVRQWFITAAECNGVAL